MDPIHPPPTQLHLSPRRELQLQGPRPSPLRVSKDSHKIRKPPTSAPPGPPREPVIIYTISPKVIHVDPANFMDLVQRLTGPNTADGGVSPAAKLATIQRTLQSPDADRPMASSAADVLDQMEMEGVEATLDRPTAIPGILSPVPASLPPISPAFFSPSFLDPSFLNFLHELSPAAFQVGRSSGGGSGSLLSSSGNFLSPFVVPSPGAAAWDLFNQF